MAAPEFVDLAVCGGGLGGLALAVGLCRQGFDVHVFEAASQLRTSTATVLSLGGNAFTSLEGLHPDIVPAIKNAGNLMKTNRNHIRATKDTDPQERTICFQEEMYTVRWAAVQNTLADLMPSDHVHCNYRATGYTEYPDQGCALVHFKGQPDVKARLVVGADGIRSALRATMLPQDPGPRFLGNMVWNCCLYNPARSVVDVHKPDEVRMFMDVDVATGGMYKHFGFLFDAGGGYTFWQLRVELPEPSFTPPPVESKPVQDDDSNATVYLAGAGLGKPGSKARVLSMLHELGWEDLQKIVEATPESIIFERALSDRIPLDQLEATMVSPGGRVVLLGDAAHAMHTGPGQGARMAFEDAHMLVEYLLRHRSTLLGWADNNKAAAGVDTAEAAVAILNVSAPASKQGAAKPAAAGGSASMVAPDTVGLAAALAEWNAVRLARVCRVQRYSAESCGLEELRKAGRPKDMAPDGRRQRTMEFTRWLCLYPECPTGDPTSTYWKPKEPAEACE